jgi:hypothetical protein
MTGEVSIRLLVVIGLLLGRETNTKLKGWSSWYGCVTWIRIMKICFSKESAQYWGPLNVMLVLTTQGCSSYLCPFFA